MRFRLNNFVRSPFVFIVFFSHPCLAQGFYHDRDNAQVSTTLHDLYEITDEANKFVIHENEKNHTDWHVGEPNFKILVPKCVIPLQVKWMPKDRGLSNKGVAVVCTQTVNSYKKWEVFVPVFAPHVEGESGKGLGRRID